MTYLHAYCRLCKKNNKLSSDKYFTIKKEPSGAQYFLNKSNQKKKVSKIV